ncbi:hypothetical protein [Streptomyces sp. MBT53]|uniref:hypothetical protein n=1 Tax=Streptomyces sp. MBT53 TaxID=1488384 RepID=UPI001913970D|nr:hypothetical protein [Streptomyces sp. MBT53]MBK6013987.1 hypothetical protein [Streptomyces sp. MBT53]
MSTLFRVRVLAVSGTRLWCAVAGILTPGTGRALHAELTDRCAGVTVAGLDLRQLRLPVAEFLPDPPWPDGPHIAHLLAPDPLRSRVADDGRLHWHTDLQSAWQAWSGLGTGGLACSGDADSSNQWRMRSP